MKKVHEPVIRMIPISNLIEDPLNKEAFNEGEIKKLADDIIEKGFFGDVAAFPYGDGMYMLESGHRRRKAAIKAGLTEIPVFITEPPKNEIERRIRLTQWNMNGRNYTPMDVAKLVKFTYDTLELKKKAGEVSGSLLDLTAKELNISTSSVTKYKALLTLPKPLQKIAESGTCSWAVVAGASSLSPDGQQALALRISGLNKLGLLTTEVLRKEIEEYKHVKLFHIDDRFHNLDHAHEDSLESDSLPASKESTAIRTDNKSSSNKAQRKRRIDGSKGVVKSWQILKASLSEDALIKAQDEANVREYLLDIIDLAQNALDRFN